MFFSLPETSDVVLLLDVVDFVATTFVEVLWLDVVDLALTIFDAVLLVDDCEERLALDAVGLDAFLDAQGAVEVVLAQTSLRCSLATYGKLWLNCLAYY